MYFLLAPQGGGGKTQGGIASGVVDLSSSRYVQYANLNLKRSVSLNVDASFCGVVGRNFIVHDNYEADIHPSESYKQFLSALGIDWSLADGDLVGFEEFRHPNGNLVEFPSVRGGKYNAWRYNKVVRNVASRKLKKIELVGIRWMGFNVLTFPAGVSAGMVDAPAETERLCRVAGEIFYKKLCLFYGGNVGAQYNFHPWSSRFPLKPHCHLHFDFLGAIVRGKELVHLSVNEGRPFDMDVWRDMWLSSLKEVFAPEKLVLFDGSPVTLDTLNVFFDWETLNKERKPYILHKFKYRDRRPLIDLACFFRKNVFESVPFPVFSRFLMDYSNDVRTFGFWNKLKTYMSPDAKIKADEKPKVVCPVCNVELTYVGKRRVIPKSFGVVSIIRGGKMLYGLVSEPKQRWLSDYVEA